MDSLTRQAMNHTLHCLLGCSIGEVLGMAIAASLHWHRLERVILATILAFFFGYLLTFRGVWRQTGSFKEATKITLATDTVSITSMEIVDNFVEFLIPKALTVTLASPRFWWSLALSLAVAFLVTVPVNRWFISRSGMAHDH
jgi:glycerol uptake facilitator-like aquaporin